MSLRKTYKLTYDFVVVFMSLVSITKLILRFIPYSMLFFYWSLQCCLGYSLFTVYQLCYLIKMAAADDLSMNFDSVDVNKNTIAWVPLSLTFVEYPQGSIKFIKIILDFVLHNSWSSMHYNVLYQVYFFNLCYVDWNVNCNYIDLLETVLQ